MSDPAKLPHWVQITPTLGVSDLARAMAFYRDVLGFGVWSPGGGYAYVERERVALRILALEVTGANPPGRMHAYVDIIGLDALFAALEPALATLPDDRWGPPADQPHLQREFWVRDPDGSLLTFGEGIGPNAAQWDYRL
ncbi:VOC family protein [Erythrobacter sp. CCH5-A1]|jgi:catechol 2,3-dioxygenase-like lactoylglutathione lyase family enzyme|uniref:bleomycin resistance protein n=1 Tax=Erythrobacter sp. CCH5-A1 TaxID=1768792 RepID=UPI00082CDA34|nr:VOC family protein [Erythrobacter sp. CCH5-A1]